MAEKKPPDLSWESFTEQRIRQAQREGDFDNLPGFGHPLPGLDEPYDELWWVKQKLRRENLCLLPPSLQIRREVEKSLERIWALSCETDVRREADRLNDKIRRANLASVWGPPSTTMPLDVEGLVARWRRQH